MESLRCIVEHLSSHCASFGTHRDLSPSLPMIARVDHRISLR